MAPEINENAIRFGPDLTLLERLGAGGMGEVFLARKAGPGGFEKLVVVKKILPQLAGDPRFVAMFLEEARLAARLHHPHIVQIYDFGQFQGEYFLTMEYVPGRNLHWIQERCRQTGIRFPAACVPDVGIAVCRALAYAQNLHGEDGRPLRIVHRDVSPTNILVSETGDVKLLAFGIARPTAPAQETTQGLTRGKALYMSPEQMRGQPLDGRSDIYALGATLFELAAGTPHLQAGTLSPRKIDSGVPRALDRILRKALSERPEDRFPDARRMEADLADFRTSARRGTPQVPPLASLLASLSPRPDKTRVAGQPVIALREAPEQDLGPPGPTVAARASATTRTSSWIRRHRALALAAALLAVCGAAWLLRAGQEDAGPETAYRVVEDRDAAPGRTAQGPARPRTPEDPARETAGGPDARQHGNRTGLQTWEPTLAADHLRVDPERAPPGASPSPSPPPAPGADEAGLPAVVRVESEPPGAEVWVDGEPLPGKTPCEIRLPDQQRPAEIRVTRQGYRPWRHRFDPTGWVPARPLLASLEPIPAELRLASSPPGAEILLQGEPTGRKTPALLPDLPAGTPLDFELRLEGFEPRRETLRLAPGQRRDVELPLVQALGGLRLQTVPWTDVYLDGRLLGKTPLQTEEIPCGAHRLTLVNPDASIHDEVDITVARGEILKKSLTYQGRLKVVCSEPTEVLVNNRSLGQAPFDDVTLPAGTYSVVLRDLEGDREQHFQVRVKPGEVSTVSASPPAP